VPWITSKPILLFSVFAHCDPVQDRWTDKQTDRQMDRWMGQTHNVTYRMAVENKKGQLSLTNPCDACETFARLM